MELDHGCCELVDNVCPCRFREERRTHRADQLGRRQIGQLQSLPQPLFHNLGRKGSGPPRGGAGEYQRPRDRRVPPVELKGEPSTKRQPDDMDPSQAQGADETGEAVRIVRQSEGLGRIR